MFLDLFLELCQLIAMKLQDFINKSEWQGPVKVNQVTEEMLQKNVELDKRLSIIEHYVFKMVGNNH